MITVKKIFCMCLALVLFSASSHMEAASFGQSKKNMTNARGTIRFTSPSYLAYDSAGNVQIVVVRTGSTQGTITVDYSTSNGTGMNGTNYLQAKGTLTFKNRESAKTINIKLVNDAKLQGSKTFSLTLSKVTNGASLGNPNVATVSIMYISMNSSSTNAQSTVNKGLHNCTASKWTCTPWSQCKDSNQTRKCEINYRVDTECLNPEAARPAESQSCVVLQDPNYESMSASYQSYNDGFDRMLNIAKTYPYDTWLVLKEILQGYLDNVHNYGTYVSLAASRQLTDDEYYAAGNILHALNSSLERFIAVTKSANLSHSTTQITPQNSLSQPPSQTEVSCSDLELSLRRTLASNGGSNDTGSLHWMDKQLLVSGCIGQQQFCDNGKKLRHGEGNAYSECQ